MQDNALLLEQAQRYLEAACPENDHARIRQLLDSFFQHKNGVLTGKEFAIGLQQHIWRHVLKELACNPLRDTTHLSPGSLLSQSDVTRFMQQHGRGEEYKAACKSGADADTLETWQDLVGAVIEDATTPGLMDVQARQGVMNMVLAGATGGDEEATKSSIDRLLALQTLLGELQEFPTGGGQADTKDMEIASLKERIAHLESAVAHMSHSSDKKIASAAEESVHARQHTVQESETRAEEEEDPFPFGTADGTFARSRLPRRRI